MADNENVIGLAMELDVSNIKEGVKEVNKIIKSSKDEFNNATAGMDMWSKSSEGLNAKLGQLGKQLSAQEKLAAGYEAEIARVSEQEGDHTEQLAKLNEKLQKARNEIKKTQSQMSHYGESLVAVEREEKDANSALGKLTKTIQDQKKELGNLTKDYQSAVIQYGKNSREAKDLAKQIKQLSGEIEDNEDAVKDSEKAFHNLSRSLEDLGSKALEKSVKGVAKVGAAITGLVGSFLATAEATREFRTNMGKVDTAFGDAGFSAEQAEETYKKFYGILGDEGQATEAVSHLAKLANNQKDLSKWTDIAAGVYGTFGDSLPIESLTEAANETAKTGEVTGSLADALNWAGISQDSFQDKLDKCNTEQERQKLITDTLTKSYSNASKQYQETNKDIIASQEAQANLSQAMADIGAKAEPLMTSIREMGTALLEALIPALDKIIPFVQDHLPALAIVAGTVTAAITTLATAIGILKLKTELATIATVAKTVAEKAATGATKAAAAAQWLLNAALSANPIGIVIVAITALVAAFVVLWKKSESFRNFWKGLWEGIKKYAKVAIDAIAKLFSACWDGIKKAWDGAGKFFKDVWQKIKDAFKDTTKWFSDKFSKAWDGVKKAFGKVGSFFSGVYKDVVNAFKSIPDSLKKFFTSAWDKIKGAFTGVTKFFSGIASDVVDGFKSLPDKMKAVGKNLVEGLWNGVKDMVGWITGKLKGFAGDVLGGIKKFFGVHSPSTEMAEIGGYMAEGLANGIEDGTDNVIKAGAEAGSQFAESFNKNATDKLNKGTVNVSQSFDSLTKQIEHQKAKLSRLESQYKSAVMTFGETSQEAFAFGRQIITLSREIEANELKVKQLDDSYKGLSGTLANQMRIELNNAKNQQQSLIEQAEELRKKQAEAGKAGFFSDAAEYGRQLMTINKDLSVTNSTIKELTANLDYMSEVEEKKAAEAAEIAAKNAKKNKETVEKQKNAYETLIATIEEQKNKLTELKTEYESAVMVFGENSDEAENLASKIKQLTQEIADNEQKVKDLDEAYTNLTPKIDTRSSWDKFNENLKRALGISEEQLKQWSKKAGQIIGTIGNIFERVANEAIALFSAIVGYTNQIAQNRIDAIDKELARIDKVSDERAEAVKTQTEEEISAKEESTNEQLKQLEKLYAAQQISAQEYRDKRKAIEQELTDFTNKKNKEQIDEAKRLNDEKAASEKKLLEEKDRLAKKQFESEQAMNIVMTTVNGATAIVKAIAELGPVAGPAMAGIIGATTAAQIATIAAQKYVPMLAKGGIADSATLAMIGEAGKEAVIPLEKNTGWMNTLAEKLSAIMQKDMLSGVQGGVPAFALAGGATTVNNYYNQTINSPKSLTRREIYRDSKNLLALKG